MVQLWQVECLFKSDVVGTYLGEGFNLSGFLDDLDFGNNYILLS